MRNNDIVLAILLILAIVQLAAAKRCGISGKTARKKKTVDTQIAGGVEARPNSWPWHTLILKTHKGHTKLCGGTIVDRRWIVTAGHCVVDAKTKRLVKLSTLEIKVGAHHMWTNSKHTRTVKADKIIPHERYETRPHMIYDIAMIHLKKPIHYGWAVSPVCLPDEDVPAGTLCVATGFGATERSSFSDILRQAKLPVISNDACKKSWHAITDSNLCTHDLGKTDTCSGDSGGPLVCQKPDNTWQLVGISSFGGRKCRAKNLPAVFTRVTPYVDWINKTIAGYDSRQ